MHQQVSVLKPFKRVLLVCLLLSTWPVSAQNLVPNGSFETYRTCPLLDNLLREATPWSNPSRATPDFYNRCFDNGQMLLPPRTGQGLARLFFDQGWAEYLAVRLTKPLEADRCYYFELFIATDTPNKYLTETLGASLTDKPLTTTTTSFIAARPQVIDTQDATLPRLRWQPVSGVVRAKGGEQNLLIGSFYKNPAFLGFYYVFIDDVSLVPIDLDLGADTTLCGRRNNLKLDATTPGATNYRWSDGSTQPTLLVSQPGTYSVAVTTSCIVLNDSIKVSYALDFDLGRDTTLCRGQTLALRVPTAPGASYRWQDGTTGSTLAVRESGQYRVVVKQATCTVTDSIQARFIRPPTLQLGPDHDLCGAETVTIEPAVTEGTFFWQDTFPDVQRLVSQSGVFRAGVRNDCATVLDSVRVSYGACDCVLYAPAAFSPNDDGLNDVFLAYGCGDITITSLAVFDRWGEVIFQTQAPPFQWDGSFRGNRCDPGVYAWRVEYSLRQGDGQTRSQEEGSLLLLP